MGILTKLQKRIVANKAAKGFNVDPSKEFDLIRSEVDEAEEAFKLQNGRVGEELADIIIYALGVSELLGINMDAELDAKIAKNEKRVYQKVNGKLVKVKDE